MQVVDLLTAVAVAVDDQPIAVLRDAFTLGKITRHREQMPDQRLVLISDIVGGGDEFVGNNEDVGRSARPDVAKGRHQLVTIDNVGGQLARDDALKKIIHAAIASLAGGREAGNSTIIALPQPYRALPP